MMNTNKPSQLFLVILALSLIGACSHSHKPPGIRIKLSSVQTATIEESSEFVASLQSHCSLTLQPLIEGQVAKIFVKPGDQVTVGTAIIQLDSAKQQEKRQYLRILAPCAGTVGNILVNKGEYVNTSTKLATITQNQPLEVNILVPAERAAQLQLGMPVELMNLQDQSVATSKVFFISPNVDNRTQTVLIKSLFDNSKEQRRTGQLVRAKVIWGKRRGVLIPATAVSGVAGENFVYVAQKGESKLIARQKPVKLGEIQGNNYQVIDGLQPGEKLIVSNIIKLSDGAAIIPES